ncbi:UNVERIFIED_CONTAM: hypothetical protein Slati_3509300 [Sesamum latifolium]|uniref:Retrotransposon Copia-like N-terminal domain-containing protein n=1 Tax=Sesamum latifolium TaxID=2727402 RepID=A0AAW2UIG1_9LAMI
MAAKDGDSSLSKTVNPFINLNDPANPYRLETYDNLGTILVIELLTTENYSIWARSMRRALRAKNKLGFIDGTITKPDVTNSLFVVWERCNDMIVSWIQNSISPQLKTRVIFVDDASEIWQELQERFAQQNGSRIYKLKKALSNLAQGDDSVSISYGKLKVLWDELSIYDPIPECTCGKSRALTESYQRDNIIQFLMGLNDTYSNSRDQIMSIDPLPPLNKVFSYIQQQERQRLIISNTSHDSVALIAKRNIGYSKGNVLQAPHSRREKLFCTHCKISGRVLEKCFKAGNAEPPFCTHCKMEGHVIEKCYKLNGYPPGHKLYGKNKGGTTFANQSTSQVGIDFEEDGESNFSITQAQYQELMSLLKNKEPMASPSANQVHALPSSNSKASTMSGPCLLDNDWEG